MVLAPREREQLAPSRAPWVVPLAFGTGGTLLIIFSILIGIGYDIFGRTPGTIVMSGIAMLMAPMLYIARRNFLEQKNPIPLELLQDIARSITRHGLDLVWETIAVCLAQLDRQRAQRSITAKVVQLPGLPLGDDDEEEGR